MDSVDQDQTAQNVQSDLGSVISVMELPLLIKKKQDVFVKHNASGTNDNCSGFGLTDGQTDRQITVKICPPPPRFIDTGVPGIKKNRSKIA